VILESLHREFPVHETLKESRSFDPTHQDSLDLMCEFPYRNPISAFQHFRVREVEETSDLGSRVSNSQYTKS
jgi:hypothetical protein